MHERVKEQIQQQTEKYIKHSNKGNREIFFEEGDLVWLHLRNIGFQLRESPNLVPEVMDLFKSSKE